MLKNIAKLDIKILDYINSNLRSKTLDTIMPIVTALGNLGLIWVALGVLMIRSLDYRRIGITIIFTLIVVTAIGEGIIKHVVKRQRPLRKEDILIKEPITYSFPSGHTASSFAVAEIFFKNGSSISVIIFIIAMSIGYSRIYLRVHYPSDVILGAVLGVIVGGFMSGFLNI